MRVAIIGGGITGISVGYFLAKQGVQVEIFEASKTIGGLAGTIGLQDGTRVDRFYHALLSSDSSVRGLCEELGIANRLKFREVGTGFYHRGRIHPMNGSLDFLRFPLLGWTDRFRLGLTVLRAQLVRDWRELERISVEQWLVRWSGQRTYDRLWRPLLAAKFDGGFDSVPATYIWSRLVRMKSTRSGAGQKELVGHLVGGHITLIEAMAAQIRKRGGVIHVDAPVQQVELENGTARGIRMAGELHSFDRLVCTLPAPIFEKLVPDAPTSYRDLLRKTEYLGIVAALLVLDRPLTGYWTLNIADDGNPFTGVIETTSYIDPQYVGGHHLVYLPKYTAPGSALQLLSNQQIEQMWLDGLARMFPEFQPSWVRELQIHRARYVEPLHGLNGTGLIPSVESPVENLFLATTAQIYPQLTNAESLTRHAQLAAEVVIGQQARSEPVLADPALSLGVPEAALVERN